MFYVLFKDGWRQIFEIYIISNVFSPIFLCYIVNGNQIITIHRHTADDGRERVYQQNPFQGPRRILRYSFGNVRYLFLFPLASPKSKKLFAQLDIDQN